MRWHQRIAGLSLLLLGAGCDVTVPIGVGPSEGRDFVAVIAAQPKSQLDLLIVVDDSGSMAEEQANLAAVLAADLLELFDELPSLHIGVTTTNLGGDGDGSCLGAGDAGMLIGESRVVSGCAAEPSDRYIVDLRLEDGSRLRNYAGSLDESLACLVEVGTDGCGFEQPLAAALRAIDNPVNDGFARTSALLGILFVTDEDDCSATESGELFSNRESLGELTSFRCFENGVSCSQDDLRGVGEKTQCVARTDDGLMVSPRTVARALRARKGADVVVGLIGPPAGPAVVTETELGPSLAAACTSSLGSAAPAPRLATFLSEFSGQSSVGSVCDGVGPSLRNFGLLLRDSVEARTCLRGPLVDASSAIGLQPDCAAFDVRGYGTADAVFAQLPRCSGATRPCFDVELADECFHTESGLAVRLRREVPIGSDRVTVVECAKDEL